MEGGTTFHFVTGVESRRPSSFAKQAAGSKDVKIGGGVSTVRQYLQAGLVDSIHLAQSPVLLGRGEALFAGIDLSALGFACFEPHYHRARVRMFCWRRSRSARSRDQMGCTLRLDRRTCSTHLIAICLLRDPLDCIGRRIPSRERRDAFSL